jgi:uncharacterized protein (TIGR03085 family)
MSQYARAERSLMVHLLTEHGPDAPTLCEGWTTRDLAAHLVIRERRPDASAGLVVKPLAKRMDRVRAEFAGQPWDRLVDLVRTGPGKWSPFALPGADEAANTVEYFVHCEDVRRAQPGWEPRALDAGLTETLWRRLQRSASLMGRKSPVGLVLKRPDGQTAVAHKGAPVVTVTGEPTELLLFMFGRQAQSVVEAEGNEADVAAVKAAKFGF